MLVIHQWISTNESGTADLVDDTPQIFVDGNPKSSESLIRRLNSTTSQIEAQSACWRRMAWMGNILYARYVC